MLYVKYVPVLDSEMVKKFCAILSSFFVNNAAVFDPVLLLSVTSGTATVRKSNDRNPKLSFSPLYTFISVVMLGISLVHVCLIPRGILHLLHENEYLLNTTNQNKLSDVESLDQDYIIKLLNPLSVSLSGIITRIGTILTMKSQIPGIISGLDDTDEILQIGSKLSMDDGVYILLMVGFMILLCFPCQMLSIFGLSKNRLFVTLLFFFNSLNNFSSACAEFQFVVVSFLIYRRFRYVNGRIRRCVEGMKEKKRGLKNILFDDFRKVEKPQRPPQVFVIGTNKIRQDLLGEISCLHSAFRRLCDLVDAADRYFSFQLLLSIAECNLNVLINMYFAIFGGYYKPEDKEKFPQSTIDILNDFIWGMYYLIRFFGMTLFASITITECKRTRSHVADLQNRSLDDPSKEEANMMLQYCANRKPKFTACGFFKIDLPLVTSAVATGCTYLVIMAQFNSDKQKKKA